MKTLWNAAVLAGAVAMVLTGKAMAWEPDRQVELIVPAANGGTADSIARQFATQASKLLTQPMLVSNHAAGGGAEGLLEAKLASDNATILVLAHGNLFAAAPALNVPLSYQDFKPVGVVGIEQFVLWVPSDSLFKNWGDVAKIGKAQGANHLRFGGTGRGQEDEVASLEVAKASSIKFDFRPYRADGDVVAALARGDVDITASNPSEGLDEWNRGKIRPLCVLDRKRMSSPKKVAAEIAWSAIPTCRELGLPAEYKMARVLFAGRDVSDTKVAYYRSLLERVRSSEEWKSFAETNALDPMPDAELGVWMERESQRYAAWLKR